MVEPVSAAGAVGAASALTKAAKDIAEIIEDIEKHQQEPINRYIDYLEIVRKAIEGLVQEQRDVLIEALRCDPDSAPQRRKLRDRIDDYLNNQVIRPKLKDALDRLREGQKVLEQRTSTILWWKREHREEVTGRFNQLLGQLEGFHGSLGGYSGPSAVALKDTYQIRYTITGENLDNVLTDNERNEIDNMTLSHLAAGLLSHLDNSVILGATCNCGQMMEAIRIAFQ